MNPEQKSERRELIKRAYDDGRFSQLRDREQFVLEQRYLQVEIVSLKRVSKMFQPPVTTERVRQIETKAIGKLTPPGSPIEAIGLSRRIINALVWKLKRYPSLEELSGMSDDELLSMRNFGAKSFRELREKLKAYQPE